jgi:hypothetical protein
VIVDEVVRETITSLDSEVHFRVDTRGAILGDVMAAVKRIDGALEFVKDE